MSLLRIAYRNLQRAPARTLVSIAAVAASVVAVILIKGTADGVLTTMEDSTIRFTAGHVRILDDEYRRRERLLSLQYPVDGFDDGDTDAMLAALRELPRVAEVVPRIKFGAMVSRDDALVTVLVVAGEPAVERRVLRTERYLGDGRFVEEGRREAVLGRRLLNRLGIDVGDRFTLVFSSAFGALRGYTFQVVGAFESHQPYLDDGTVFIPLDVARRMTDLGSGVTEVLLMAHRTEEAPALLAAVEGLLERRDGSGRYRAIPWYEHSEMTQFLQAARVLYDGMYALILLLGSFVIVNTFLMIVHERRREIGLLSALGLRPGQIRLLFLLEGALCGLLGSLVGVAAGTPLVAWLSRIGFSIPGTDAIDAELMYPTVIYPMLNLDVVRFAFLGGIVVSLLAVYFPARQAAKLAPTDALRT